MSSQLWYGFTVEELGDTLLRFWLYVELFPHTSLLYPHPTFALVLSSDFGAFKNLKLGNLSFLCSASTMRSRRWLKNIINLSKVRKPRSNKMKGFSVPDSYNLEPQPQEKSKSIVNDVAYEKPEAVGLLVENIAATRIQTAFRVFKARKTLRNLKGVLRLQTSTQGDFGKKQASNTLISLQSWSKIQAQIRTRRKHMVEEGRIRRKKSENQLKLDTKLHDLEVEWSDGFDTKDEALARIQQREEAAVKRERAMAYAFSHQWRPNSKSSLGQKDSKLATANWDWSWVDRWVVAQPWENRVMVQLTPKKVNSPANKALKNSTSPPKKALRNRKLSYGAATKVEDQTPKTA
ncbi:hypothetical protein L1987_60542 [Smallanthus sonchifolius]|uniref:Uncharacterized protein n=1 Tax=Smallanthus sonchifolius TaxID=185202 RepID=A0ACB9D8L0_9ASTR|nr:hypothetical protein L1987_60542 [Smallanthus sonchifolius]